MPPDAARLLTESSLSHSLVGLWGSSEDEDMERPPRLGEYYSEDEYMVGAEVRPADIFADIFRPADIFGDDSDAESDIFRDSVDCSAGGNGTPLERIASQFICHPANSSTGHERGVHPLVRCALWAIA
jgi:hypothetical protein